MTKPHQPSPPRGSRSASKARGATRAEQAAWEARRVAWRTIASGAAIVIITLAAYWPALSAQFIGYDDNDCLVENTTVRSLEGLWRMWTDPQATAQQYYPCVTTTYWIEYHLWGLAPRGYHLVNVLLHATAAVLFWRLLTRLAVPGAWLAGIVFALHPVAVESVAWVAERKNVLSLALALGAMLCYLRFAPANEPAPGDPRPARPWAYYALALGLFVLALMSKTVVAPMPVVILLLYWWKRGRIAWRDVPPLAPFFAVALALGLFTVLLERSHVGAEGTDWEISLAQRILLAGRVPWFYAAKTLWPYPVMFFYPRWDLAAVGPLDWLFPAATLATLVALWLARGRIGRGPLVAVLIFLGGLFPASGFFNVWPFRYSFVADHYQYHAFLALIALVCAAGANAVGRWPRLLRTPALATGACVALLLGMLTYHQAGMYHDLGTLSRDAIAKNPESWIAHSNLGTFYDSAGQPAAALEEFLVAVRLAPTAPDAQSRTGFALLELNRPTEAAAYFTRAYELRPSLALPSYGLGAVAIAARKWGEAQRHFEEALRFSPNYAEAHQGLALALLRQGQLEGAEQHARRALEIMPDFSEAHQVWAEVLMQQQRPALAAQQLAAVVRLDPGNLIARNHLGRLLRELGRPDEAVEQFRAMLRQDPDNAEARANLDRAQQLVAPGRRD